MIKYILKRILYLIPVMLLVTLIVFFLMSITKGDPARIVVGESASLEEVEAMRESMGLNDPFFIRYLRYVRDLFLHGNMGTSYKSGLPVMKEITSALPSTIRLSLAAITIAILIGIPIGIISATKQYSFFDNFTMILGLIGISMPVFWLGLLLILLFSVRLGWFPPSGLTSFRHVVLPAFTLGTQSIAVFARMTRSSMLEVIRQDYIRTVRAKGHCHRGRHPVRQPPGRRGALRDHLFHQRRRPPDGGRHQAERFPRGTGGRAVHLPGFLSYQPAHRHRVLVP